MVRSVEGRKMSTASICCQSLKKVFPENKITFYTLSYLGLSLKGHMPSADDRQRSSYLKCWNNSNHLANNSTMYAKQTHDYLQLQYNITYFDSCFGSMARLGLWTARHSGCHRLRHGK